ncbi:MAG: exo-alpha-sialidase [Planctomycetaceae bacterium]|nr:exo-alpha-sialidase [Planctomycetaceae bacterium]
MTFHRTKIPLTIALCVMSMTSSALAQIPTLAGVRQIIAHRGSSVDRPENTLASLKRAIEAGATAVEVDVRTTKDGELVMLHDATLDRTTNGVGPVAEKTWAEVKELDAGSWFDPKYRQERVPTLQEVLIEARDKIDVLLDLKGQGDEYVRKVVAEVKKHGSPKRTLIGVRSIEQARLFRKLLPEAKQLGLIPNPNAIEAFAKEKVETIRLWPKWIQADAKLGLRVKQTGAKLHLNGTTGQPDDILPLLQHQPESLSSDAPARLVQTLAEVQSKRDAKDDKVRVIWSGKSPNKLACDTTLREMPDGSWVMVMLGGGDREPLPANRIFLTRSADQGKTWSPMQPIDLGVKTKDPNRALVPTELMVYKGRCTMLLATHDGRFGDWKTWMCHSDDSCRTWGLLIPAPGKLAERTFIRNTLVTRDGQLMLPFQHYEDAPGPLNPRNGVIISKDDGKTWSVYGDIRTSPDDNYRGWAEPNIVELADGSISMLIRADRLGGVLYRADSHDGGKTWSKAYMSDIPNPGSKATLYSLGGDRVALLHNPNPKSRNPLSVWVSFDAMKTWAYRRDLVTSPGRLNYPDGFVSRDGKFLHFAFDDNRHRAVYVKVKMPTN